jgi:hypothetical protein
MLQCHLHVVRCPPMSPVTLIVPITRHTICFSTIVSILTLQILLHKFLYNKRSVSAPYISYVYRSKLQSFFNMQRQTLRYSRGDDSHQHDRKAGRASQTIPRIGECEGQGGEVHLEQKDFTRPRQGLEQIEVLRRAVAVIVAGASRPPLTPSSSPAEERKVHCSEVVDIQLVRCDRLTRL